MKSLKHTLSKEHNYDIIQCQYGNTRIKLKSCKFKSIAWSFYFLQIQYIKIFFFSFSFERNMYNCTKIEFFIENFFSKYDQIRWKLPICSHLLKKSLMENFISLCSVCQLIKRYIWDELWPSFLLTLFYKNN